MNTSRASLLTWSFSLLCLATFASSTALADARSRADLAAPEVTVTHDGGKWLITGKKQKVNIDQNSLAMTIDAPPVSWSLASSEPGELIVKSRGEECSLRLIDAGSIAIEAFDTGAKTGVKITLGRFRHTGMLNNGLELDLTLYLTVCLEGKAEELVFDIAAAERETTVRQLDWPKEVETRGADYTALSNVRGNLLPVNWPHVYHPFRTLATTQESPMASDTKAVDHSYIQSNLIECWSMAWWGFAKGDSALVLIVETSADVGYKFEHPAGGPTVIGPRWLASLGRLAYPRTVRMSFLPKGNYVDMAKRYRQYAIDSGRFVSLKEKIARQPLVAELIGAPHEGQHALKNYKPLSHRWSTTNPSINYQVKTFDQLAQEMRDMKAAGVDHALVQLAAWPNQGYDRQHPDVLPPAPAAGGWDGFKRWFDTAKELGYIATLHDQYRDYYIDAPSWDPQFAAHEETAGGIAHAFPGSRFGDWKVGYVPMMDYWDGGAMGYLNSRFALAHMVNNDLAMFEHGVHPQGSGLDVFGYVPPTEDFNPEHPETRSDDMAGRIACFNWVRAHLGVVGTEAGSDWTIPYVDYCSDARLGSVIPAPLYELVYHDAIMTPEGGFKDYLRCLLNAGYPAVPSKLDDKKQMDIMRQMIALHKRLALLEMTNHEFLDKDYQKERTTFADGTTVTIDRTADTVEINPPLKP
jgi:hypothetical protein